MTQWLTAINDNTFRWLIVGIAKQYVGPGNEGLVLTAGLALFVLPYLILASPAGYLADRFSKRNVIIACKFLEIGIMILGVVAIMIGDPERVDRSLFILFTVVALMGSQSALFAPSKMGAIPEMLPEGKISAANGWFGLATVTATMIGMAIGGKLADNTGDYGQGNVAATATVLVGLAITGTIASFGIQKLPLANPHRAFPWLAPVQTFLDLRVLFKSGFLFRIALGKVFFWSIAAMAQLNIDQFVVESGALYESERTPLLIMLVLGVGFGSVAAGLWSGNRIELGLLAPAATGIIVFAVMTANVDTQMFNSGSALNPVLITACFTLMFLGFSAGMLDVPLGAYLQQRSPAHSRGQILSAVNFLIFSGMLIASGIFYGMRLPVYQGSLSNIPPSILANNLNEEERQNIVSLANRFEVKWKESDEDQRPRIESYLEEVSPAEKSELLAQLLWIELQEEESEGDVALKSSLFRRFPDDKSLVKAIYDQSSGLPLLSAREIFLFLALMTLPVLIYVLWRLPQATLRFLLWNVFRCILRIEVQGLHRLPERKAAIIIANHPSQLDRLLLLMAAPRAIHWVSWRDRSHHPWLKKWEEFWKIIRITGGPTAIQKQTALARKTVLNGGIVAAFSEHGDRYDEQEKVISEELLGICMGINVSVIPVYFDVPFDMRADDPPEKQPSSSRGKQRGFMGKLWRSVGKKVVVRFGRPQARQPDIASLRRLIENVGVETVNHNFPVFVPPAISFLKSCKRRKYKRKAADSSGADLSGGMLLTRTLVLRNLLNRHVLGKDEKFVGVLLPPAVASVATNMALTLDRRVVVNLNYSASEEVLNQCIEICGIKHVLTSRQVMDKLPLKLNAEMVSLEDLAPKATQSDKISAVISAFVTPAGMLASKLKLKEVQPNDPLTIIFTSGSTGTPKGVVLSQYNIHTNVQAINEIIHLNSQDTILGILPFFHSFGYTVTLWGSMGLDVAGAYHYSPLDGRRIGRLCKTVAGTCLLSTPTFLRGLMRKCKPEDLETMQIVVAGAERLPKELCDAFEAKFGVRPVEGYGATELSPLACVNVPPSRSLNDGTIDCREGTVGKPIPQVEAKIVDLESGQTVGPNKPGMLWIKGPNVMQGYFKRPDLTDEVIVDGWYKTGDIAMIDDDGFVIITGRESRFSKIGGEMVPHIKVEEEINAFLGADEEEGLIAAVTAVPDEKKGERLIVIHTKMERPPAEICKGLREAGLPNLFIPSEDSFFEIGEIPVLGTGKLDLKGIKTIATEKSADS